MEGFFRQNPKKRKSAAADVEAVLKQFCCEEVQKEYRMCRNELEKEAFREGFLGSLEGSLTTIMPQLLDEARVHGEKHMGKLLAKSEQVLQSDALLAKLFQDRGLADLRGTRFWEEKIKPGVVRWGLSNLGMSPLMVHNFFMQHQFLPGLEQHRPDKNDGTMFEYQASSSTVKKKDADNGSTALLDWVSLEPMPIKELRLFQTHTGYFLNVTIVGQPALETAVRTVIQDDAGGQATTVFYNCMGGAITPSTSKWDGQKMVEQRFAVGTKLQIANPFYKIGAGGARAIRVDDPREVKFLSSAVNPSSIRVDAEKARGNAEFAKGAFDAAREIYQNALAATELDLQVSLLNNRAFMFLNEQNFGNALLDAAAVMYLRPDNEKAWHRYISALEGLQKGASHLVEQVTLARDAAFAEVKKPKNAGAHKEAKQFAPESRAAEPAAASSTSASTASSHCRLRLFSQEQRAIYEQLLTEVVVPALLSSTTTSGSEAAKETVTFSLDRGNKCNEQGKSLFREKKWAAARTMFTEGLLVLNADGSSQPLAAILGNLTTCALRTGRSAEGLALSLITLRLFGAAAHCAPEGKQCAIRNKALMRVVSSLVNLGEEEWVAAFWSQVEPNITSFGGEEGFLKKAYQEETQFLRCLNTFDDRPLAAKRLTTTDLFPYFASDACNLNTVRTCDWIHPDIELRDTGGSKGRGVFAKTTLQRGTALMVCKPDPGLLAAGEKLAVNKSRTVVIEAKGDGVLRSPTQKQIQQQMFARVQDDLALAWRLHQLYDGSKNFYEKLRASPAEIETSENDGVKGADGLTLFTHCLPPIVFPVLPPSQKFVATSVRATLAGLSETRLGGILTMNEFGSQENGAHNKILEGHTVLHVQISMFNHSLDKLNVGFLDIEGRRKTPNCPTVMYLEQDVSAGDELFIAYTNDRSTERAWIAA
ncbi:unnamed protein product [Amoebophrya sp. A120]|nr:unnamed protein product [Amoebophrya sp. A120]|eukprot:GSA120T00000770001.1